MPNADLYAMMHGAFVKENTIKNKTNITPISKEINDKIEEYLNTINFNEEDPTLKFQNPEMKRAQMKIELQNALKMSELEEQVGHAVVICRDEGEQYLSGEQYSKLIKDFFAGGNTDVSNPDPSKNLKQILKISDATIESMLLIANGKYAAGKYEDCLAVMTLLLSLEPEIADYWYRMGIAAQQCKKYEVAIQAYQSASDFDPSHYQALIFAADCYLTLGLVIESKEMAEKAKKTMAEQNVDSSWEKLLSHIEEMIIPKHA